MNKVKQKYNSLTDISWTKFHRHTLSKIHVHHVKRDIYVNCPRNRFTQSRIITNQTISFPLPDKKYKGKRFMRYSLKQSARMYNLCQSTTRKISTSTYYHYKPKAVKLQGQIPFRQSCCEKYQNFENILNEASKYLSGIPSDVGEAIDRSLCECSGYFPKVGCILHTCETCSTDVFKNAILSANAAKLKDERKRFLVKLWVTKTERKDGVAQSFLDWKFERCNYTGLIDLLMEHMSTMSEHTFMASWNYVQYKQAKKIILVGDVIFVHDFVQNYLCQHQNEFQGLHWRHKQVTIMPIVVH